MFRVPDQYGSLIEDLNNPIISILNPQSVSSKKVLEDLIEVYLNDQLIRTINVDDFVEQDIFYPFYRKWKEKVFMNPRYINNDIILFSGSYSSFYLLKNHELVEYPYHLCFINEREMIYERTKIGGICCDDQSYVYHQFFGQEETALGVYNQVPIGCFIEDVWDGCYKLDSELLKYEVRKYFNIPFDVKNFTEDLPPIPEEDDILIMVNKQEYHIKELREFYSSFLNDQIDDREGNEIILPISKIDQSVECLYFFNSLKLKNKLFCLLLEKYSQ